MVCMILSDKGRVASSFTPSILQFTNLYFRCIFLTRRFGGGGGGGDPDI